jgi:hypothetical protein
MNEHVLKSVWRKLPKPSRETIARMQFATSLKDATCERLRTRLRVGMNVWRGTNGGAHRPADPGDFGRGTYYSTSFFRAQCHGKVSRVSLRLDNPLILTVEEAYSQIADRFLTVRGTSDYAGAGPFSDRELRALEATQAMIDLGYDGVVSVTPRKNGGSELEIVRFPVVEKK